MSPTMDYMPDDIVQVMTAYNETIPVSTIVGCTVLLIFCILLAILTFKTSLDIKKHKETLETVEQVSEYKKQAKEAITGRENYSNVSVPSLTTSVHIPDNRPWMKMQSRDSVMIAEAKPVEFKINPHSSMFSYSVRTASLRA